MTLAFLAPDNARAAGLTVIVTGAGPGGEVRGMIFRDAISFDHQRDPVAQFALPSTEKPIVARFADLPPGRYAIACYHDSNGNGRLDKTLFGMPTEPYGFSNNARATFGPPDFDQAVFEISPDADESVTFSLR